MLHIYRGCPQREELTLAALQRNADILKCHTFKENIYTYIFLIVRFFFFRVLQMFALPYTHLKRFADPAVLFVVVFSPHCRLKCFCTISSCFQLQARQPTQPATIFHPPRSRFVTFFFSLLLAIPQTAALCELCATINILCLWIACCCFCCFFYLFIFLPLSFLVFFFLQNG